MGRTLEPSIYRRIEWNLHNIPALEKSERIIVKNVLYGSGAAREPGMPRGSSKPADPTAVKAIALTDSKPTQWLEVIQATYAYFDEFSQEGRVARMFYGKRATNERVAEKMQCTRQTVKGCRDNFVFRCALFAAERGLIHLSKASERA